jgi:hypothetical protein
MNGLPGLLILTLAARCPAQEPQPQRVLPPTIGTEHRKVLDSFSIEWIDPQFSTAKVRLRYASAGGVASAFGGAIYNAEEGSGKSRPGGARSPFWQNGMLASLLPPNIDALFALPEENALLVRGSTVAIAELLGVIRSLDVTPKQTTVAIDLHMSLKTRNGWRDVIKSRSVVTADPMQPISVRVTGLGPVVSETGTVLQEAAANISIDLQPANGPLMPVHADSTVFLVWRTAKDADPVSVANTYTASTAPRNGQTVTLTSADFSTLQGTTRLSIKITPTRVPARLPASPHRNPIHRP